MEGFEKSVKAFRVEDPNLDTSQMGPLISKKQLDTVQSFLGDKDDAVAFTGSAPTGAGYWMPPTVLMPKSVNARTWQEEIFGPVVSVAKFDGFDQAMEIANDTLYGLGSGVWTRKMNTAYRAGREIQAGRVWTNCYHAYPAHAAFGGYKSSGIGRETHKMMLDHYQQTKNLLVSYSESKLGFF